MFSRDAFLQTLLAFMAVHVIWTMILSASRKPPSTAWRILFAVFSFALIVALAVSCLHGVKMIRARLAATTLRWVCIVDSDDPPLWIVLTEQVLVYIVSVLLILLGMVTVFSRSNGSLHVVVTCFSLLVLVTCSAYFLFPYHPQDGVGKDPYRWTMKPRRAYPVNHDAGFIRVSTHVRPCFNDVTFSLNFDKSRQNHGFAFFDPLSIPQADGILAFAKGVFENSLVTATSGEEDIRVQGFINDSFVRKQDNVPLSVTFIFFEGDAGCILSIAEQGAEPWPVIVQWSADDDNTVLFVDGPDAQRYDNGYSFTKRPLNVENLAHIFSCSQLRNEETRRNMKGAQYRVENLNTEVIPFINFCKSPWFASLGDNNTLPFQKVGDDFQLVAHVVPS